MRVEALIPMGRKAGRRVRKALPKTMDIIQSRVERIGSGVVDRVKSVGSSLRSSAAVSSARKAVRRGSEKTAKWVRKNPNALPLLGLGGALITTLLMLRARRQPRRAKFFQGAMKLAGSTQLKKGFGSALGRFVAWALSPRKPHVFRAVSIRW